MKNATQLFNEFLPLFSNPSEAAALFAEDGILEIPYLEDLGMQWQYRGRSEISGLMTKLHELIPDWKFTDAEILISTPDQVFAEYHVRAFAVHTQRPLHQHFFGRLVAEHGEIKLLREALNIVETARVLFPNGLADIPARHG